MFKIVSVGWTCAQFLECTLASVEAQTVTDWEIMVTYDPSPDGGQQMIEDWCAGHENRHCRFPEVQQFAVRNQVESILTLAPADEDIIVFLDLDGDQLAHPQVLQRLLDAYSDGTLLTYGNYRPEPYVTTCGPAVPFPADVVVGQTYRRFVLSGRGCCFNHLRTMKGKVFRKIPLDRFYWTAESGRAGEWLRNGTDYAFMINGLELVHGRYKCLDEVLLVYNHANPLADNLTHPADTDSCVQNLMNRPPLAPGVFL